MRALRIATTALFTLIVTLTGMSGALADQGEDVENFDYAAWDVTYDLSLDDQSRAQAQVTERLEVQFPEFDQNRGIIRSLPLRYQSAPAAPEDISVTDADGNAVPFEIDDEDGLRNILVGDDAFVHGDQTYVISYTLDDVMHATEEADEFYWDLVPVDRQQDIGQVTAEITLDETLTSALTGHAACYRGTPDDTADCQLTSGDAAVFTVDESQLAAGHGLTVAIGVQPGTVTQPPERHDNVLLDTIPLILVGVALLIAGGGAIAVVRMTRRYRNDTSQTNIAYGVPEELNPLLARWLIGSTQAPIVAMILDLAVRGVLRIEERDVESRWTRDKTEPVLRLMKPEAVSDPLERDLLQGMFPELKAGQVFTFPKNSKTFNTATQQVIKDSGQAVIDRGYQMKRRHRAAAVAGWIALALLIPVTVLLILGASRDNTLTAVFGVVLGLLTAVLAVIGIMQHRVLTPSGAALRRQLERVRDVITASEADRLTMMQSFEHAPRQPSIDEPTQIAVYDRLLPYAVLFGKQKDWSEVMAQAYAHQQLPAPIWYPALLHHGTIGIQDSLHSMLDSVSSAAATSSPAAGSTGAGAAGGGGGGGAAGGR